MCGRFTRIYSWRQVRDFLDLVFPADLDLPPSYNVAPTQTSPIVRRGERGREAAVARWGLVPSWAKDPSIGSRMINARAETAAEKPAFRVAFKRRRCVVPVSGFYEWQKRGDGPKVPHYITRADGDPMLLAGLWEAWDQGEGPLETFTILTTTPNALMRALHDRMPVILERERLDQWLDPGADPGAAADLLVPAAEGVLDEHAVGTRVNSPRNNDPGLVERV